MSTEVEVDMTRLTLVKNAEEAFAVRGRNTATDSEDNWVVFYDEITKVHVVPERENFTIQVVTSDLEVEMDFANAQEVRKALAKFPPFKIIAPVFPLFTLSPNHVKKAVAGVCSGCQFKTRIDRSDIGYFQTQEVASHDYII